MKVRLVLNGPIGCLVPSGSRDFLKNFLKVLDSKTCILYNIIGESQIF